MKIEKNYTLFTLAMYNNETYTAKYKKKLTLSFGLFFRLITINLFKNNFNLSRIGVSTVSEDGNFDKGFYFYYNEKFKFLYYKEYKYINKVLEYESNINKWLYSLQHGEFINYSYDIYEYTYERKYLKTKKRIKRIDLKVRTESSKLVTDISYPLKEGDTINQIINKKLKDIYFEKILVKDIDVEIYAKNINLFKNLNRIYTIKNL